MTRGTDLYARARDLIPGGSQLLSKRPELFLPEQWPAYFRRANGVEVEDLDGHTWIDVSIHAVGACPLGYADPDVDAAVIQAIHAGTMSTLNCPEEVELAELLCDVHPWADMARFTRGGGEAMAVAARIARAATGRERVAICGYHGWHDWYLAANLADHSALDGHLLPNIDPVGVPASLTGSVIPFPFADVAALDTLVDAHGSSLAAIIIEPARYELPPAGYLERLCERARAVGAVVVFDEVTTGFRVAHGGVHLTLGVSPDVAVFAKGMSNGYPMGAVIGRRDVMEAAGRSFISSTYWTDRIGPVAALATIRKLRAVDGPTHLAGMGQRMRSGWEQAAAAVDLAITTRGIPPLPVFGFADGDAPALATLYRQSMLDAGFLATTAFYPSCAHDQRHVDAALAATQATFELLRTASDEGTVHQRLRGPVAHTGLRPAGS